MEIRILIAVVLIASCGSQPAVEVQSERGLDDTDNVSFQKKELAEAVDEIDFKNLSEQEFFKVNFLKNNELISQIKSDGTSRQSHIEINDILGDDEEIFSLKVPDNVDASYGAGFVSSQGANLLSFCQGIEYSDQIPSLKDFFQMGKEQSICGKITLRMCVRINLKDNASTKSENNDTYYEYLDLPRTDLTLPCKFDSFSEIDINIGQASEAGDILPISVSALPAVSKIYFENNSECTENALSSEIDSKQDLNLPVVWGFTNGTKESADLSFKFIDIYGFESSCISNNVLKEDYVKSTKSSVSSDTTDTQVVVDDYKSVAPTAPAFIIGSGLGYTNKSALDITFTNIPEELVEVSISESDTCNSEMWEQFSEQKQFTISNENSTVTISVQFRNSFSALSECTSKTVVHDSIAPTSTSASINSGDLITVSKSVELSLSANEAESMYITNSASCVDGGQWEDFATTKYWVISDLNPHGVYVRFRDQAGNISPCISTNIIHLGWEDSYNIEDLTTEDAISDLSVATDEEGSALIAWVQKFESQSHLFARKYENYEWGNISIISLSNGLAPSYATVVPAGTPGDYHVGWVQNVDGVSKIRIRSY